MIDIVLALAIAAFAQEQIEVPSAAPCWENQTAGIEMWRQCGLGEDWARAATLGFEWVLGGNFTLVLVGVIMLGTYIKYHKAVYPLLIGVAFLPVAAFAFPTSFVTYAMIMAAVAIGILIWYAFVRQTRET